jgi:hypothetical protein
MAWVDALRDGGIPADGALMDSLGPVWRRQLARLLPELDEPVPPAEAGGDPLQLFEALARLLEALAQRAPLVILIEDGHWMDEMSRRLLPFLARRIRPWRLLWVSTFREEELAGDTKLRVIGDDLAREGLAVPLRLAPLSRAETLALVGQLVPPGTPASTGEEIWRTSEGNAFMAVETARILVDPERGVRVVLRSPPIECATWWPDGSSACPARPAGRRLGGDDRPPVRVLARSRSE